MSKTPRAKTAPSSDTSEKTPFAFPFHAFENGGDQAMRAWTDMNQTIIAGMVKVQEETSRFIAYRLQQDIEQQKRLLTCTTPTEFFEACAGFANQAIRDYSDEANRMAEIAGNMSHVGSKLGDELVEAAPHARDSAAEAKPQREPAT